MIVLFIATAFSIKVTPGVFTAQGVPVGEEKDFGIKLSVYNSEEQAVSYSINKVLGEGIIVPAGYEVIPDISWILPENNTLLNIEPLTIDGAALATNFPNDNTLYNRRFHVHFQVLPQNTGLFRTGVVTTYFIETESSEEGLPWENDICIIPSSIDIDETTDHEDISFTITNTTEQTQSIYFTHIPPMLDTSLKHEYTYGYSSIPENIVRMVPENVVIEPQKSLEIKVIFILPTQEYSGQELIIFIVPDDHSPKFIRIRID